MREVIQNFIHHDDNTPEDYQALLDILFNTDQAPLSEEELKVLVKFFPEEAGKELQDSFIHIVQSVQCGRNYFKDILENIPSESVKEALIQRMKCK